MNDEIETARPFVFIDFEYNNSQEPNLNLVCCCMQIETKPGFDPLIEKFWLHGAEACPETLSNRLSELQPTHTFCAYAASAEARSFLALALDPHEFQWIDLYAEWRQIQYNNNHYLYGRYVKWIRYPTADGDYEYGNKIVQSVPPSLDPRENIGKDNMQIGTSLAAALCCAKGIIIDTDHKTEMRDLILSNPEEFTDDRKTDIMDYCAEDITHLKALLEVVTAALVNLTKHEIKAVRTWQIERGRYSVCIAKMEQVGIPLDLDAVNNLSRNYKRAIDTLVRTLNEDHYEFYIKKHDTKKDLYGHWSLTQVKFEEFLSSKGLLGNWPKTEPSKTKPDGQYKKDNDTLKEYEGVPGIYALRQTMKSITQINWFRGEAYINFMDHVGSDNRLRSFLGPFGTQTGRNAPTARTFPLAMANWLRCLVRPEEGYEITGIDYANQEFVIAAVKSEDPNMIEAYTSGDPYLHFAKQAGGVPEDATKESHPVERDLFKSTVLGLQYGMGVPNLTIKLRNDTGRDDITEKDAARLKQYHKKIFRRYWKYQDVIEQVYKQANCLILADGWILGPHCDRITSVKNFPIQGLGAVIMRRAIYLAQRRGVDVIAPLHDAKYAIHLIGSKDPEILAECMQEAVESVLPGTIIRLDVSTHTHDEPWIESRGADMYEQMKQYLSWMEADADIESKMLETIYVS